ncbi:MAG TPA: hypothetical protein VHP14_22915 [Anaerolineales bacterium]|nr:hypothetical protein [Anaerolineales bacterium]
MPIRYKDILPWGRSFDEYTRMFNLTESELSLRILGCGDGPASFNAECNRHGGRVTSVDPLYRFSRAAIANRIAETYDIVMQQTGANRDKFIWNSIPSLEDLGRIRMEAMQCFLASYEDGRKQGHYIPGELPELPFSDQTFDLALSSHFLFLYTDNLSFEFHVSAIREMLRAAHEVRIFPLLDVNARTSCYLSGILEIFREYGPEVREVDYEFQRGGNQMLVLCNL